MTDRLAHRGPRIYISESRDSGRAGGGEKKKVESDCVTGCDVIRAFERRGDIYLEKG